MTTETTQIVQLKIQDVINNFLWRARGTNDIHQKDAFILGAMQMLGYEREGWQIVTLSQIQAISPLAYEYAYANW